MSEEKFREGGEKKEKNKIAGRELDALIHTRVFEVDKNDTHIPHYSTDIAATMPVLGWLMQQGDVFIEWWQNDEWYICNRSLYTRHKYHEFGWEAMSDKVDENEMPSLPLAICRAALKAIEEEEKLVKIRREMIRR